MPSVESVKTVESGNPPGDAREIPRRKGKPIIGSTMDFQSDQIAFVTSIHEEYGDVVKTRIVNEDWVFVRDPEIIHEINVRRADEFQKPRLAKTLWKLFLGNGLVPNDGEHWRRQHDMVKPGFHRHRIDAYAPSMVEYTQHMLAEYQQGEQRDIRRDINNLALWIVGKTLFNAKLEGEADTVFKAMHDISEMLVEHINMPLPTPRWWPSPGNRRKIAAIEAIEGVIHRLIAERRAEGVDKGDLLSTVVFAKDEKGLGMTAREMRDEAMTLIFAGHETTAHNMTWCWYLLCKNPDKAAKAREEIDRVVGKRSLTVEDLDHLPYLNQVMKESFRIMPAVWTYMREPIHDVVIKGWRFKKGNPIFISPLVMGRDSRWHPNPEKFEPERWTREYERKLPKGSYTPFAAGPRVCLGQGFAQMEFRLIIGTLLQNLEPKLAPGFEPDIVPELSMHPGARGLQIAVDWRADAPLRPA